jgi:hypothetical protein
VRVAARFARHGIRTVEDLQRALESARRGRRAPIRTPELVGRILKLCRELLEIEQPRFSLGQVLGTFLSRRSIEILVLRYGLKDEAGAPSRTRTSLEVIGKQFGLSRERVRQLESESRKALSSRLALACLEGLRQCFQQCLHDHGSTLSADELRRVMDAALLDGHDPAAVLLLFCDLAAWATAGRGWFSLLPMEEIDAIRREANRTVEAGRGLTPLAQIVERLSCQIAGERSCLGQTARVLLEHSRDVSATVDGKYFRGERGLVELVEQGLRATGPALLDALWREVNSRLLPGSRETRRSVREAVHASRLCQMLKDQRYALRQG